MGGGCSASDAVRVRPVIHGTTSNNLLNDVDERNLELYYLFWLDPTVRSPEHIDTKDELRAIVNYLKVFERNSECVNEFNNVTKGKIFLLVSCVQSIPVLPVIHDHKSLHSIYIYHSGDTTDMQQISKQYRKVFLFNYSCEEKKFNNFFFDDRSKACMIRS